MEEWNMKTKQTSREPSGRGRAIERWYKGRNMFGRKNEKTVIQFDNEERRKMGFLQALYAVAAVIVVALIFYLPEKFVMSQAQSTRLNGLLFAMIMGWGVLLRHYIEVLDKKNAALVISYQGIVFNGTELGRGIGLIAWKDIEAVDKVTEEDGECLYLRLKEPEKYSGRIGGEDAEQVLKEGVELRAEGLKAGFEWMEREIRRYFEMHSRRAPGT
jgi:hypothetical protein